MTTFFTSVSVFAHKKIIELTKRPFETVEQMNNAIIERWNSVVSPQDTVYHLGDFTLGGLTIFYKYFYQLNGNMKIVPGNHDRKWLKDYNGDGEFEILPPLYLFNHGDINIVLCHYPLLEWQGIYRGWTHLYGHVHGSIKGVGLSLDVGVDCHSFYPLSLDEVVSKMKEKTNE